MENYKTLEKIFNKIYDLNTIGDVLSWDNSVVMPVGGSEIRAEQMATISSIKQAILTDPSVIELLENAGSKGKKLSDWQQANLRLMKNVVKHAVAVPADLLKRKVKETTACEMVWREARKNNDFKLLKPNLEKVVKVTREIAKAKAEAFGCSPYEALLDQYDSGRKEEQIDTVFDNLKEFLPDFIQKVIQKQEGQKIIDIKGEFPADKQKELAKKIMEVAGFDFNRGRLDESHHPFCGGYSDDVRITTRYDESDFITGLMGIMHETGHALYELDLPKFWRRQPVGQALGMSVHESQSLLIEMQASRTKEFLTFALPLIQQTFGVNGKEWNVDNLYNIYTKVKPSLIRVDADEVTYPAHIIMRYYIEKYLINGEMEVDDLPDAWAQGMEKFLGVTPSDDKDGCMQDIHWVGGDFGYFPTYTLGAIYAAQFFAKAKESDSNMLPSIEQGNFAPLRTWLSKNIHEMGSRYSAEELAQNITGSGLDVEVYKKYLAEKYLGS